MKGLRTGVLFIPLLFLPLRTANGKGVLQDIPPAQRPKVVVVANRATLNRHVRAVVRGQLEKALSSVFDVVPSDTYVRQALNTGYTTYGLATLEAAATIGAEIEVTHVFVLEGLRKRKRRTKRLAGVQARLLDVKTGHWAPVGRMRVRHKRLARGAPARLVSAVAEKLRRARKAASESTSKASTPRENAVPTISSNAPTDGRPATLDTGNADSDQTNETSAEDSSTATSTELAAHTEVSGIEHSTIFHFDVGVSAFLHSRRWCPYNCVNPSWG
ncbi:hypothetical protein ACFL6C_06355 [Myxococcota bacterium]